MFRNVAMVLLLSATVFGQMDDGGKKDQGASAPSPPEVRVSRPGPVRFGGFWLGGGGAFADGRELPLTPRLYRPCCWHDPWFDVFSPVGVFENCFAYPGQCGLFSARAAETGEIALKTRPEAEVFINGGFAGLARDLEKMRLPPGVYELKVVAEGFEAFEKKIYLLSGKRVEVKPDLAALEVQP